MVWGAYTYADPSLYEDITAALAVLTPDRQRAIGQARGIELVAPSRWQTRGETALNLAARLGSPSQIGQTLDKLSARELATLRAVWRLGPTLSRARIGELLAPALPRADLRRALSRLEDLALLLPTDDTEQTLFVPAVVRGVLAGNESAPRPLRSLLAGISSATLGRMAQQLGAGDPPKRKEDRLAYVHEVLLQPENVRRQLIELSDAERAIFDLVVERGGMVEPYRVVQKFPGSAGERWRGGYGYGYNTDLFLRGEMRGDLPPLLLLQARGLLLPYPAGYPSMLVVPDEVLVARLPEYRLSPSEFVEPPFGAPPVEAQPAGVATTPLLDLLDALQYAAEVDLKLTKAFRLPKPPRVKLARLLGAADPAYADFLLAVAIAGEIVRPGPSGTLTVRKKALDALLDGDDGGARLTLLIAWLVLGLWYDPGEEPYLRGDGGSLVGTPRTEREAVLRLLLTALEQGATLASLAARLRYHQPRHFSLDERGLVPYAFGERAPALGLLLGVLRVLGWLGLAEPLTLPARPGEAPLTVALRLTPLGRDLIAMATDALSAPRVEPLPRTDRIVVQPTLDILAPPNIEPRIYRDLRRFADLSATGGVRTLTLSAASLRRALDAGATPDSIRAFLERHAGTPPATVNALIGEAAGRYGRVQVGNAAVYLTVDDPPLLAELAADRRLADLGLVQVAPTVGVMPAGSAETVIARLRAAGHMPIAAERKPAADPLSVAKKPSKGAAKPAGKQTAEETDPAVARTLAQAQSRDEKVEVTYRRRGNSGPDPVKHTLTILELGDDEVYGRCWLCNTSVRLAIPRITEARLTGEGTPEYW